VLEGARSGLLALRHLLEHAGRPARAEPPPLDAGRRDHWARALEQGEPDGALLFGLLRAYGIRVPRACPADTVDGALAAAARIGYPVVLKTGEPGIAHKSDAGGVVLGSVIRPADRRLRRRGYLLRAAGARLRDHGRTVRPRHHRDPDLGPLVVIGAGGLPSSGRPGRGAAAGRPGAGVACSAGCAWPGCWPGARAAARDTGAVADAVVAVSAIACELGGHLEALDINPLICGPAGAVAVDALAVRRSG
jgi:hypothetical protein